MIYLSRSLLGLIAMVSITACAEKHTASDSGNDMYIVSDGILVIDNAAATRNGVQVLDRAGSR